MAGHNKTVWPGRITRVAIGQAGVYFRDSLGKVKSQEGGKSVLGVIGHGVRTGRTLAGAKCGEETCETHIATVGEWQWPARL